MKANSKVGSAWRKYFFSSNVRNIISKKGLSILNPVPILKSCNYPCQKEQTK